jgi:hypothetical protein
MSNIFSVSDIAYLPPEDVATIRTEERQALVDQGLIAPDQPGLTAPFTGGTTGDEEKSGSTGEEDKIILPDKVDTAVSGGSTTTTKKDDDDDQREQAQREREQNNAFSRMQAALARYGLSTLEGAIRGVITGGMVDLRDENALLFAIREEPAYKQRFAANEARRKANMAELDPATYLGLEDQYRNILRSNGLPVGFFDETTDFQGFIEGDVSPAELQERVQQGYRRVAEADPAVKQQMRELYGVSEGDLAAYFLDPKRAQPLLTTPDRVRQAKAAQIAARGLEQGKVQLAAGEAEGLVARGVTAEEAEQRFAERGLLQGLYEGMTGEEMLTRQEELGATFGYDIDAQKKLAQRRASRVAEFRGGGGFARTTGATSGTIETGVGSAQ